MPTERTEVVNLGKARLSKHIGFGIVLVFTIPVLTLLYLRIAGTAEASGVVGFCHLLASISATLVAAMGYLLLKEHTARVRNLRNTLARIADRERLEVDASDSEAGDFEIIEKCIEALHARLDEDARPVTAGKAPGVIQTVRTRKLECVTAMADNVSHDFSNYLSAIRGNASILLRSIPADSPCRQNVEYIENTTNAAIDLTCRLRTCSGGGKLMDEDVNVTSLIHDEMTAIGSMCPKGIEIIYRMNENVPYIPADPSQVKLALISLVQNAADALKDAKGIVTVSSGVMQCSRQYLEESYIDDNLPEGRYVFIEVSDNGRGIPPDVLENMFDAGFTTKLRGCGLGLAMVMGIARSHSGAVRVETAHGKGSTFRILFPTGQAAKRLQPPRAQAQNLY